MRKAFELQKRFDCPSVLEVELNHKCRDEIIPILESLKHIYSQPSLRDKILNRIAQDVNGKSSSKHGRPGMDYWQILVLSSVRLGCNLDYDKLQDLAEQHQALRHIMGIGDWDTQTKFDWRRINQNLCRVSPETIQEISEWIALEGQEFVPDAFKSVRGDSFVVSTNIHYPTDSSLIGDGLRKLLNVAPVLGNIVNAAGWRQHNHLQKKLRRLLFKINKIAQAKGKHYKAKIKGAYQSLFHFVDQLLAKTMELMSAAVRWIKTQVCPLSEAEELYSQVVYFASGTDHVCGYAKRRVLKGETIPNEEKLFSLFEPQTELINRGKSPNPIEFGHRVFIVENAAGFICHFKVMEIGEQDQDVLIPEMKKLQSRLNHQIEQGSFDRGFHTPDNQIQLKKLLKHPCLAAKGKLKQEQQEKEATIEFRQARQNHPGVESAIGALQSGNGQDRCRDRTDLGYKRYVALGILGRNLHTLGKLIISQSNEEAPAAKSKRKQL